MKVDPPFLPFFEQLPEEEYVSVRSCDELRLHVRFDHTTQPTQDLLHLVARERGLHQSALFHIFERGVDGLDALVALESGVMEIVDDVLGVGRV